MSRTTRWILLLLAAATAPLCLEALHFLIGRPDRIRAAARRDDLLDVRDQILRYQYERGELPSSLDILVPRYLQPEQIRKDGKPLYVYLPDDRMLREAEGSRIKGLAGKRLPPFSAELPLPEERACNTNALTATLPESATNSPTPDNSGPMAGNTPDDRVETPQPAAPVQPEPQKPEGPVDAFEAGMAIIPQGPALPDPPRDALVFEGEHYSETNYGWEVHADKNCSGGAYLHTKEGIANGPGQTKFEVGDFYNLNDNRDKTYLIYHLNIPKTGSYHGYARMWTTDTHCSNSICASFDKGGPYTTGMGNRTPFRWVWSPMGNNPVHLTEGEHYLHLFIHEDGVRIDQFILSPARVTGGQAYKANLLPGENTAWRAGKGSPLHLMFDLRSMVMTVSQPPECNLAIRSLRPAKGRATVRSVLHEASEDKDIVLAEYKMDLGQLPELCFLPLDFGKLDVASMQRKEYLLSAGVSTEDGTIVETHLPLMRPYAWKVYGPGRFLPVGKEGPLDGTKRLEEGMKGDWVPFKNEAWSHFGVMDFGLHLAGNSKHAPSYRTIYARTTIHVPEAGNYLLKIQSDDQMIFWIDGETVIRHGTISPVTRTAIRKTIRLEKGKHLLKMRVNQQQGPWQATVRIRTPEDNISTVYGLPAGNNTHR